MMKKGLYIVIDGLDGSGKGTVFEVLNLHYTNYWRNSNEEIDPRLKVVFTREPGGTPLAEKIRELIVHDYMDSITEFFLFLAQRREVRKQLVEPALLRGESVISDRSDSSTWAFQIFGRQEEQLKTFFRNTMILLDPLPDLYIILDVPAEIARERLLARKRRGGDMDRIDSEKLDFHDRARKGFQEFSVEVGVPCVFVDASRKPEEVALNVLVSIAEFFRERLS